MMMNLSTDAGKERWRSCLAWVRNEDVGFYAENVKKLNRTFSQGQRIQSIIVVIGSEYVIAIFLAYSRNVFDPASCSPTDNTHTKSSRPLRICRTRR